MYPFVVRTQPSTKIGKNTFDVSFTEFCKEARFCYDSRSFCIVRNIFPGPPVPKRYVSGGWRSGGVRSEYVERRKTGGGRAEVGSRNFSVEKYA